MADADELGPFRQPQAHSSAESAETSLIDLLSFEVNDLLFAVRADRVARVIPWTEPALLPQGHPAVRGVVQDRGTIVAVLWHPLLDQRVDGDAKRIVVCSTEHGLLGLPATRTRAVARVPVARQPAPNSVIDNEEVALTFIEPRAIADTIMDRA